MNIRSVNGITEEKSFYVSAKVDPKKQELIEKQQKAEQKRTTIYAADTNILNDLESIGEKKVKAQRDAMKKMIDQFKNDLKMDNTLKEIEECSDKMREQIGEYGKKIEQLDSLNQSLMEEYGITEDSAEYKQVKEIESRMGYTGVLTEEGLEKLAGMELTDYQKGALVLDGMKGYYGKCVDGLQDRIKGNNQTVDAIKLELVKNDGMIGAVKEAEKILEDNSNLTVGSLIQFAVDYFDKKLDQAKETGKEQKQNVEEQKERIEASKETREERQTKKTNEAILESSEEGEKDLKDLQRKLTKMAEDNQMLADDVKGLALDSTL